jgi:hypothetical protein
MSAPLSLAERNVAEGLKRVSLLPTGSRVFDAQVTWQPSTGVEAKGSVGWRVTDRINAWAGGGVSQNLGPWAGVGVAGTF